MLLKYEISHISCILKLFTASIAVFQICLGLLKKKSDFLIQTSTVLALVLDDSLPRNLVHVVSRFLPGMFWSMSCLYSSRWAGKKWGVDKWDPWIGAEKECYNQKDVQAVRINKH